MPSDLDQLQGAWAVTALEVDGQSMSGDSLSAARIVIEGDRFTSAGMGATYSGKLKLATKSKPRHIDMHFEAGPEAGNLNRGIYELKAGVWKLCLATRGDARPADFATEPGSGHALETLKRAPAKTSKKNTKAAAPTPDPRPRTPGKRSEPAAPPPPAAGLPAPGEHGELDGEWRMVSGVMNGVPMEESLLQWVKRVNIGNVSTVLAGPQTMLKVEFTIDASRSPHAIDYLNLAAPNKGKRQQGIYAFEGDLLKICVAAPGVERPKDFHSLKGDGRTFTVWKKA